MDINKETRLPPSYTQIMAERYFQDLLTKSLENPRMYLLFVSNVDAYFTTERLKSKLENTQLDRRVRTTLDDAIDSLETSTVPTSINIELHLSDDNEVYKRIYDIAFDLFREGWGGTNDYEFDSKCLPSLQ